MAVNFKPSKEEEEAIKKITEELVSKIKIKDAKAVLGGSGAKGTWLSGTNDIDIYVKFNYRKYKSKSDKLADYLETGLKKAFKIKRLHGSRDYFQVKYKGFTVEIVPILDIKNSKEAVNITDVSQLHVDYVLKHKKLNEDIRKAKAFTKALGVYGAESYIKGFSGYVLELLIINYNGFNRFIKAVSKWKDKTEIGNKKDVQKLNYSKKSGPLVVIDPVQKERNAAAAISKEKYEKFIQACREYVKKPSDDFFIVKKISIPQLKKKYTVIQLEPKAGKNDVIGAKLVKLFEFIKNEMRRNDFIVTYSDWIWDNDVHMWFEAVKKLSKEKKVIGPFLDDTVNLDNFRRKYHEVKIENGRVYSVIQRKFVDVKEFLLSLKDNEYVKEKVKDLKVL